jgi:hypothetical protein
MSRCCPAGSAGSSVQPGRFRDGVAELAINYSRVILSQAGSDRLPFRSGPFPSSHALTLFRWFRRRHPAGKSGSGKSKGTE